jgi:hypothetical protein
MQEIRIIRRLRIVHNQGLFFYFRLILVGCPTQGRVGYAERIYEMGNQVLNISDR